MLNDFVKECFEKRPASSDITAFAIEYFSDLKKQYNTTNKQAD